jgi:hypothetical protein
MPYPRTSPAGETPQDIQLWNTYLFWAFSAASPARSRARRLRITKRANRIKRSTERNLQAILFAAFAIEYRLKRIYEFLGLQVRRNDTLGALVTNFRQRMATAKRPDGKGHVKLPTEWTSIEKRLKDLCKWRNAIAHANYKEVLTLLPSDTRKSLRQARKYYNTVIDTIRVTNRAIGYEAAPKREDRKFYARLKIT